jgi:hypothetical protein
MTKGYPPLVRGGSDDLWDDVDADPLLDEPIQPVPEATSGGLPRSKKHFARVLFSWLAVSERDGGYSAWVRLHLCLWFRSHEGKRTVRLTSAVAAEAHLDRKSKLRRLRQLEARGLVSVVRDGRKVPVVTVKAVTGNRIATPAVRETGTTPATGQGRPQFRTGTTPV